MKLKLAQSSEARSYPDEIRDRAIGLAQSFAWFSARTYFWILLGLLALIALFVAASGILPEVLCSIFFGFGLMSLAVFVPYLMARRLLITRRDEILRIIRGGFNGADKDRPPSSS